MSGDDDADEFVRVTGRNDDSRDAAAPREGGFEMADAWTVDVGTSEAPLTSLSRVASLILRDGVYMLARVLECSQWHRMHMRMDVTVFIALSV